MEGRRSSVVLFLLALGIAAGSLAWLTQDHLPNQAAGKRYVLVEMHADGRADNGRLAVRTGGAAVSMAGFANAKNRWFAVRGINNSGSGGGGDIPSQALVTLLGALANNGTP